MYEPSPFEDSRGLRLAADDDFMRSLDQLEDLLEEDLIAATAEHLQTKEQSKSEPSTPILSSPEPGSAKPGSTDTLNRFGGSILDAIPLAERLAECLESADKGL
ncbi:MAG: hypothetical protein AAGJ69_10180 [Cyanobacteria bacterium J06559_1]